MSDRISLFDELKTGGYETCLLTTFNIDFPFYEDVMLRRMRSSGIYHHVVLADKNMCLQAMSDRPPQMAGQHYSLAPMTCSGAFHPKVILLLGKNKGFLAVGSHNATLSGYGQNIEITNAVRFHVKNQQETLPLFLDAFSAVVSWLAEYGSSLPIEISESVHKTKKLCPWLESQSSAEMQDFRFIYSSRGTPCLWDQVQPILPPNPTRIIGMSAFFDQSLKFLQTLSDLEAPSFLLGVQPDLVQAPDVLLEQENINIVDSATLLSESDDQAYIHAKLVFFESADFSVLISGSANLSAPAWLDGISHANAEAVLVRLDSAVNAVVDDIGLNRLEDAPLVRELTASSFRESLEGVRGVSVVVVAYSDGQDVRFTAPDQWSGSVEAYYSGSYGRKDSLSLNRVGNDLVVKAGSIKPGQMITITNDGVIVGKLILHNVAEIQRYTATGLERKMRQALGSLGTGSPEIGLLFDCIDKLTADSESTSGKGGHKRSQAKVSVNRQSAETLVSSISDRKVDKLSGRLRLAADGDIGLIMDVLMHFMQTKAGSGSHGVNEDKLGRNEEEQVGADDQVEVHPGLSEIDQAELLRLCHRKYEATLKRLDQYLSKTGKKGLAAALGVATLSHQLVTRVEGQAWLTRKHLASLFGILCGQLLDDKDGKYLGLDDEAIYSSDDWGRLLGYVTWLAYSADIGWRERLQFSAKTEEKDLIRWSNACWLYLAQRLAADELATSCAADLIEDDEPDLTQPWLESLKFAGEQLVVDSFKVSSSGFNLAKSPNGAFEGYRLAVDQSSEVWLASIKGVGDVSKFGKDYLDVV
jgi:hypothetical protein